MYVRPELAKLAEARGIVVDWEAAYHGQVERALKERDEHFAEIRALRQARKGDKPEPAEEIEAETIGEDRDETKAAGHKAQPVSLSFIARAFRLENDEGKNWEWWKERTRNAKRYKLLECRGMPGRGNRQSTWYPDRVAGWLVDRKDKSGKQVAAALRKHFPRYEETAIQLGQIDD